MSSETDAAPPSDRAQRVPGAVVDAASTLMTIPVGSLIKRPPFTLPGSTSIRSAVLQMREQRISSVLLVEQNRLVGIATDRDLRNRVIAEGRDTDGPVSDIATLHPHTVQAHDPVFNVLLLMARHNIHHVPVMNGAQLVGMITATDLAQQHSTSAVYLVRDIHRQTSVGGLQEASQRIKALQQSLAAAETTAYNTGHIITTITDAVTVRLLQLAQQQLGPAPVEFAWVAAGSQARSEQTARTDQDNCMVLDDRYDPALHGAYFKALAEFVCRGLDACGYVFCPGEMMAMTDGWRQPRRQWIDYFTRWTAQPDPQALMLTCVFFDLRHIEGNANLLDTLRREVLSRTRGNGLFLAHMVANALRSAPPLGMLGRLITQRRGEHKGTIDLKQGGIAPIVELARICALSTGDDAVNTHDRLSHSASGGVIGEQSARDLRDALEFLGFMRIQHQSRQIAAGLAPDNMLRPEEISNFERTQLKNAFSVVQQVQAVLGQRYRL